MQDKIGATRQEDTDTAMKQILKSRSLVTDARSQCLRASWRLRAGEPFRTPDWEEAKTVLLARVSHPR